AREAELTAAVTAGIGEAAVDMGGRCTLGVLGALLGASRLLVSNDTGVSHLAAALDVPSVVIITTSDSRRWAPLDRDRHRVLETPDGDRWSVVDSSCPGDACAHPQRTGAGPTPLVPAEVAISTALELL
ncbi:MAG: glycosyltransferase family 9 protein, partial [Candidatus Dormibacteria bacterium]